MYAIGKAKVTASAVTIAAIKMDRSSKLCTIGLSAACAKFANVGVYSTVK